MAPSRSQEGGAAVHPEAERAQSADSGQTPRTTIPSFATSQLCPWVSTFTSLAFSSLIWKMGKITESIL